MTDPQSAAILFARVFLGLLFLFQGYDKLFNVGMRNVIEGFSTEMQRRHVPAFLIRSGAWFTSLVEFICGGLLILGLAKYIALYFLCFDIILVSIAFSFIRPMWDMQFVFPRVALLIFLLVAPSEWDYFTLDFF